MVLRRRALLNGALMLAATLAALVLIEIGARVHAHLENRGILRVALDSPIEVPVDEPATLGHMIRLSNNPRIVYELRPGISVTYQGARVTVNEAGFRGTLDADGDGFRLVGSGDSFMFGLGVADHEPYLVRLGQLLRETFPARRWQVINTAVPGYNTVMEVETLKEKGLLLRPDLALIEFVGNDFELPNFIRCRKPVWAIDRSFLVELVKRRLGRRRFTRPPPGEPRYWKKLRQYGLVPAHTGEGNLGDPAPVPPEYAGMVGWGAYERAMRELAALGDRHGFAVVVASLGIKEAELRVRARQLALDLGLHWVDVGAVFRHHLRQLQLQELAGSPLALSETDPHPSPLGHEIAAETLLRYLIDENLVSVNDS